jgi:hypothetical protein
MKTTVRLAVAAVVGASALAFAATDADAAIACNAAGWCWHVHRSWAYPAEAGIVIHPDGWRWGAHERFVWREPPRAERGYWRGGVWVKF